MKSSITKKVKMLWPIAAFGLAVVLLVAFISASADTEGRPTEEELRKARYESDLYSAHRFYLQQKYHEAADIYKTIEAEYSDLIEPDVHYEIADTIHRVYPQRMDGIRSHLAIYREHYKGNSEKLKATSALEGEMHNIEGRYEEAIVLFKEAVEGQRTKSSKFARVYMGLGRAYNALEDYSRARKAFQDVLDYSVYPSDISLAAFFLGEIHARYYAEEGDFEDAKKALAFYERNRYESSYGDLRYASRVRIGDVLLALEKFDEARAAYLSALEATPSIPQMQKHLPKIPGADKDALLEKHIMGVRPKYLADVEQATKFERIIAHLVATRHEAEAAQGLCEAAEFLKNRRDEYLRAAILFERCALKLGRKISDEKDEIRRLSTQILGTIDNDRLVYKQELVEDLEDERRGFLLFAAERYEKAFDADPAEPIGANPLSHPLWKSASLHIQRGGYATAERVLRRIISPRYLYEPLLLTSARMKLGEIYRISGRCDDALSMFRYILRDQRGPSDKGQSDFLGSAALQEALTLQDDGRIDEAEEALKNILRDDNDMGLGIYSRIWWEATFALGRLYYDKALSADTGRMQAFVRASDLLRDAVERYQDLAEPETIFRSTFFLADCLHQAGMEAINNEQKPRVLVLLREARKHFESVITFDTSPLDVGPLCYRNSRLLFADTFFFDARLSDDPAHRQVMYTRAIQEYSAVSDALHGTEQGVWALVQLGNVYKMLGKPAEAERQYDKAAFSIKKLENAAAEMANNPEGFDQAYFEVLLQWFRDRNQ